MGLKFLLLIMLGAVAVKGCGLDLILEDIYDYSDSEEDSSDEKPKPPNSTPAPPPQSTSAQPSGVTPKPFPITPMPDSAPPTPNNPPASNNSSISNGTSRALDTTAKGIHRHHLTHRRHVVRRIPIQRDELARSNPSEGVGLYAGINPNSVSERYAPDSVGISAAEKEITDADIKGNKIMMDNKEQKNLRFKRSKSKVHHKSVLVFPLDQIRSSIARAPEMEIRRSNNQNSEEREEMDLSNNNVIYIPVLKSLLNKDFEHSENHKNLFRRFNNKEESELVIPLEEIRSAIARDHELEEIKWHDRNSNERDTIDKHNDEFLYIPVMKSFLEKDFPMLEQTRDHSNSFRRFNNIESERQDESEFVIPIEKLRSSIARDSNKEEDDFLYIPIMKSLLNIDSPMPAETDDQSVFRKIYNIESNRNSELVIPLEQLRSSIVRDPEMRETKLDDRNFIKRIEGSNDDLRYIPVLKSFLNKDFPMLTQPRDHERAFYRFHNIKPEEQLRSSIRRDFEIKPMVIEWSNRNSAESERNDDFIYLPILKNLLNKESSDNRKTFMINRGKEQMRPLVELFRPANKPVKSQDSYYAVLIPKIAVNEGDQEEQDNSFYIPKHVMLQQQNPRKPIIVDPDVFETQPIDQQPDSSNKNRSVNEMKEHIFRETTNFNPADQTEERKVFEQYHESIIKKPPSVAQPEAHEKSKISAAVLDKPMEVNQNRSEANGSLAIQISSSSNAQSSDVSNKVSDKAKKPEEYNTQILIQRPTILIQDLPGVDPKSKMRQGTPIVITNSHVVLKNVHPEEMHVESSVERQNNSMEPNKPQASSPLDASEIADIYHHSHNSHLEYPINNPTMHENSYYRPIENQDAIQEENFYVKPHYPNSESMMHPNPEMPHQSEMYHMNAEEHHVPHHESMYNQNHQMPHFPDSSVSHELAAEQPNMYAQELPLVAMINDFKGHNEEHGHVHQEVNHHMHQPQAENATTAPIRHQIINAV